jgi:hypothetical protein
MQFSRWRKSSFSGDNNECVEVANTLGEVRDSKNAGGSTLHVNLASAVQAIKAGRLAR